LTFRGANQRRDLVRRTDRLPAHYAKLLHEQTEESLPLLRRSCAEKRPEISGPLRDVDRLVHHAEVIVLRGDSYRLKGKGKEVLQPEAGS
jgi:hypothetical protein